MISNLYKPFIEIAEKEFSDIVENSELIIGLGWRVRKIRFNLSDNTFVDVWYSRSGRYSFHWEHTGVRDYIYRHDNAPHNKWRHVNTFPKHCHDGSEENVVESDISDDPVEALIEFMTIVREKLKKFKYKS